MGWIDMMLRQVFDGYWRGESTPGDIPAAPPKRGLVDLRYFLAIAIIDFASGGIRPRRLNWMVRKPASVSNCVRVSIDQNLIWP